MDSLPGRALDACAYLAAAGFADYVLHELGGADKRYGDLILRSGGRRRCHWCQDVWLDPRIVGFAGPEDAARALAAWAPRWSTVASRHARLQAEIAARLPAAPAGPWGYPLAAPPEPSGAFVVLDERTLLAASRRASPFPAGGLRFRENRRDPPSSAYLKLWEACTRLGRRPRPGQRCLDAGACPGGWTWVLAGAGAEVLSLDRSPLAPALMANPLVRFRSGNAFAVTPDNLADFGWERLDWLCSDLICYPAKLLEWLRPWLERGMADSCVLTLKMQGSPDWDSIDAFAAIEGGALYHGCHNKHELTWIYPAPADAAAV